MGEQGEEEPVPEPARLEPAPKRRRTPTLMHKSHADAQLPIIVDIVKRVHAAVFGEGISVKDGVLERAPPPLVRVLPSLRQKTLQGCVICLTGMPLPGYPLPNHPLAWWCMQLGAVVEEELAEHTTH